MKYNTRILQNVQNVDQRAESSYDTAKNFKQAPKGKPKTFEKFRVQTNIKKISLYLTQDSNKTLKNILTCLNSNLVQEAKVSRAEAAEEMSFGNSQRDSISDTNESLGEMSHSTNLSNIFDSLMKDYAHLKDKKPEGLADFENIPHKVSMAAPSQNQDEDQDALFHESPTDLSQSSAQFIESLSSNLKNVFRIDQINDTTLKLKGCTSLLMESFIKHDYIPKQKKTGVIYKKEHQTPKKKVSNFQEMISEQMLGKQNDEDEEIGVADGSHSYM